MGGEIGQTPILLAKSRRGRLRRTAPRRMGASEAARPRPSSTLRRPAIATLAPSRLERVATPRAPLQSAVCLPAGAPLGPATQLSKRVLGWRGRQFPASLIALLAALSSVSTPGGVEIFRRISRRRLGLHALLRSCKATYRAPCQLQRLSSGSGRGARRLLGHGLRKQDPHHDRIMRQGRQRRQRPRI